MGHGVWRRSPRKAENAVFGKGGHFQAFYPIEDVFLSYKDAELSWDNARGGFAGQLRKQAGHAFPSGYTMSVVAAS